MKIDLEKLNDSIEYGPVEEVPYIHTKAIILLGLQVKRLVDLLELYVNIAIREDITRRSES